MFRSLHSALNFVMKERAGQGIGIETAQAKFISEEHENYSWEHGFLGIARTQSCLEILRFRYSAYNLL